MITRLYLCVLPYFLIGMIGVWLLWSSRRRILGYYLIYHAPISAGVLSGSLHALTGPDHTAALVPLVINKRWLQSSMYGLIWGLGHGLTSLCIGYAAFAMKGFLLQTSDSLQSYQYIGDLVVGTTLAIIGVMGIYESQTEEEEGASQLDQQQQNDDVDMELGSSLKSSDSSNITYASMYSTISDKRVLSQKAVLLMTYSAVLLNGATLGMTWDGLPSLAPALMLDSYQVLTFLIAYLLSTMVIMSCAAGLIGEVSHWVSRHISGVSHRLARLSSYAACALGVCWITTGGIKFSCSYMHAVNNDGSILVQNLENDWVVDGFEAGGNLFLHVCSVCIVLVVLVLSVQQEVKFSQLTQVLGMCDSSRKEKVDSDL